MNEIISKYEVREPIEARDYTIFHDINILFVWFLHWVYSII